MNTRLFTWNSSINIAGDMAILSDMYFLWLYSAYNKEDYKAKTLLQWVPLASLVQSLSILYAKCYFVGVRLCRVCTHSESIRAFIDTDAYGLICAHIDTHRHTHTQKHWFVCAIIPHAYELQQDTNKRSFHSIYTHTWKCTCACIHANTHTHTQLWNEMLCVRCADPANEDMRNINGATRPLLWQLAPLT